MQGPMHAICIACIVHFQKRFLVSKGQKESLLEVYAHTALASMGQSVCLAALHPQCLAYDVYEYRMAAGTWAQRTQTCQQC